MMRTRLGHRLSTVLAVGLLTVGCMPAKPASSPTVPLTSPSPDTGFSAPQASDCRPSSLQEPPGEVKGSHLWALLFTPLPIKAGVETKIVWRMGGRGVFNIVAETTHGTRARLTFGPAFHDSSTWTIPNTDEWGTGFIFRAAGCWRVHAWRDDTAGDVYFLVGKS